MDQDVAACEAKLGKAPPQPQEKDNNDSVVTLSKSVTQRLESGSIDGDRVDNYDTYWINKLACIDESHSVRNNLDIEEAEEKLKSLTKYAESAIKVDTNGHHETMDKDKLKECFRVHRGETLKCDAVVENFVSQVDQLMYDAVRKQVLPDSSLPADNKKLSYAERFKRDFRL